MSVRSRVLAAGSVLLLLAACTPDVGRDEPTPSGPAQPSSGVLTVPEAVTAEVDAAEVRGYVLVSRDRITQLCTGLAGSFPPQCGMPALTVEGLETSDIPNPESDQGIVWSGETTLRGSLSGGVLTVG